MTKLLDCPFCGEEAALYADDSLICPYWVECMRCEARGLYFKRPDQAADCWNTRHDPLRAKLKALVETWREDAGTWASDTASTQRMCAADLERVIGGEG